MDIRCYILGKVCNNCCVLVSFHHIYSYSCILAVLEDVLLNSNELDDGLMVILLLKYRFYSR